MTSSLAATSLATVGFASHAAATLAFAGLTMLLVVRWRIRGVGIGFLACLVLTIAWAAFGALDAVHPDEPPSVTFELLDTLRSGAWLGFLALLISAGLPREGRGTVASLVGGLVALNVVAIAADHGWLGAHAHAFLSDGQLDLIVRLAMPVAGLILIENLVRNGSRHEVWTGKFLFIALGAMWSFDLFVNAHALLFRGIDPAMLAPRAAIQILMVPLLAVAAARNPSWTDIGISRGAVFHSASLMGSGLFLLLMACAGYYLREFGGNWGPLLQVGFLVSAGILLAVVVTSGRARGQLRVFISKHFFSHKYDYRLEWHRFIDTLGGADRGGPLRERVIEAVADIMDSPGGAIWLRPPGASEFVQSATWNFPAGREVEPAEGEFAHYLKTSERIVTLPPERARDEPQRDVALPDWLAHFPQAWLVVPLKHHDALLGFLVLQRPRAARGLDWEDWDLLRTVGRQAASYLAEQSAIQAIADARQLEAFNRRFAFVVHDVKNLVSPLALMLANAARHGDDPEFQHDMLATVGDSVAHMKRLLGELGGQPLTRRTAEAVPIATVLDRVGRARTSPALAVEAAEPDLVATADADLLATALGHLVQNAIEAVRGLGHVTVRARRCDDRVAIEIEDDGPGMSPAFVRDELFRPLTTTKASGYGIGAFQARELVREMGGRLDVASTKGAGTIVRVSLPIPDADDRSTTDEPSAAPVSLAAVAGS